MTDLKTIEAARKLFASDTPGDKLGRRLLALAERERAENQQLRDLLSPLKEAVLYARSQRRPMGIGQDSIRAPESVRLEIGIVYGRERGNPGFWIGNDELGPDDEQDANPAKRIAVALLRLAYAIADKVKR